MCILPWVNCILPWVNFILPWINQVILPWADLVLPSVYIVLPWVYFILPSINFILPWRFIWTTNLFCYTASWNLFCHDFLFRRCTCGPPYFPTAGNTRKTRGKTQHSLAVTPGKHAVHFTFSSTWQTLFNSPFWNSFYHRYQQRVNRPLTAVFYLGPNISCQEFPQLYFDYLISNNLAKKPVSENITTEIDFSVISVQQILNTIRLIWRLSWSSLVLKQTQGMQNACRGFSLPRGREAKDTQGMRPFLFP